VGSSEEGFVRLTYRFVGGRPVLVRKKRVKRLPDAFAILVVRSDEKGVRGAQAVVPLSAADGAREAILRLIEGDDEGAARALCEAAGEKYYPPPFTVSYPMVRRGEHVKVMILA